MLVITARQHEPRFAWQPWGVSGSVAGRPEIEGVTSGYDWRDPWRPTIARGGRVGRPAGYRTTKRVVLWAGRHVRQRWGGALPKGSQFDGITEASAALRPPERSSPSGVRRWRTHDRGGCDGS